MKENTRKLAVKRRWDQLLQRGPSLLVITSSMKQHLPADAIAPVEIGQQQQQQSQQAITAAAAGEGQRSEQEEEEHGQNSEGGEGEEASSGILSDGESEADSLSEEEAPAAGSLQFEGEAVAGCLQSEEEAPAAGSLQFEGEAAAACLQSKGEAATGWLQSEGEAATGSLSELQGCSPANARAAHLSCRSERIASPAWAQCRGSLDGLAAARLRRGRRQPTGWLHQQGIQGRNHARGCRGRGQAPGSRERIHAGGWADDQVAALHLVPILETHDSSTLRKQPVRHIQTQHT